MQVRRLLNVVLLTMAACWGVPAPRRGLAPQAWRAEALGRGQSPAASPLVPLLPEATTWAVASPYRPFITEMALPAWSARAQIATTNNSIDSAVDPGLRGFPVCLRNDAIRYALQLQEATGEIYITATVQVQGHAGNCDMMAGDKQYLVVDSPPGTPREQVSYRVVSSAGFAPPVACDHPSICPPVRVPTGELEQALGGLRLGAVASPAAAAATR